MKRLSAIVAAWCVCAVWGLAQQQPTFRTGIEIFRLDVSVLDKNRQPVRGLTAADFTVLEDGKPQKIVALSEIDIPDPPPPPAAWMRDVTPDTTTNQVNDKRLFVIVMDDGSIPFDPFAMRRAKDIARDFIARLGPADLTAVVFTQDNRRPQDFTTDHAKLLASIERTAFGNRTQWSYQASIETLWAAARFLIEIPERRKSLIYITGGVPIDFEEASTPILASRGANLIGRELMGRLVERTQAIFAQAARANVSVYAFDVCGLRPPAPPFGRGCEAPDGPLNVDFMQIVAANTGGKAFVHTNDFKPGIEQVFRENASYYLLGYAAEALTGKARYRRIDVRVNRADVEVRARERHYMDASEVTRAIAVKASPAAAAIAGLVPSAELPMRAQLAPFAIPGRTDLAAVVISIGVGAAGDPAMSDLSFVINAFDPEGRPRGTSPTSARVTRATTDEFRWQVLGRQDLKPGPYQLRIAAHDRERDKSGSVYADIEIPEFAKAPLSLSGLILSSGGAPDAALSPLLPMSPTATRTFAPQDRVIAFARVYQGGDARKPLLPVTLTTRITDGHDVVVHTATETMTVDRFAQGRAADVRIDLPLGRLQSGPHLLTIEVQTAPKTTMRRAVRFAVR